MYTTSDNSYTDDISHLSTIADNSDVVHVTVVNSSGIKRKSPSNSCRRRNCQKDDSVLFQMKLAS